MVNLLPLVYVKENNQLPMGIIFKLPYIHRYALLVPFFHVLFYNLDHKCEIYENIMSIPSFKQSIAFTSRIM